MGKSSLEKIALVGRTYNEYERMFNISPEELSGKKILDAAAGVSNFCAVGNIFGLDITAVDEIYNLMVSELEVKCEEDLNKLMMQLPFVKDQYNWDFFGGIEGLKISRVKGYKTFLKDFEANPQKYRQADITNLPFEDQSFNISLASHLFFLNDNVLDFAFHQKALLELIRVTTDEVIIFPVKNLQGNAPKWYNDLLAAPEFSNYKFVEEEVDFEFQKGNHSRLKIKLK